MLSFLDGYKTERGVVGFRIMYEKAEQYWPPIVKRMELTSTHYAVYDLDTTGPQVSKK